MERGIATDCDLFLRIVGKEVGKEDEQLAFGLPPSTPACGGYRIARRENPCRKIRLRKISSVQSCDESGLPLFCAGAKRIVTWIWRYVTGGTNVYQLSLFPQQIDDRTNQIPPNTESSENLLVFRENFLANEPGEYPIFQPVSQKRSTRILRRYTRFESGDSGREDRGVDYPFTRISAGGQRLSPAIASFRLGAPESPPRFGTR